jgi:hypothetical protein
VGPSSSRVNGGRRPAGGAPPLFRSSMRLSGLASCCCASRLPYDHVLPRSLLQASAVAAERPYVGVGPRQVVQHHREHESASTKDRGDGAWAILSRATVSQHERDEPPESGAAAPRLVLSVRPGYECAVTTWLQFKNSSCPWHKGPAPVPGQDDYFSIANEIRALNGPPAEGIPGDSWEVDLPTMLVWLDPDPGLPKRNPAMRRPPVPTGLCGCQPAG